MRVMILSLILFAPYTLFAGESEQFERVFNNNSPLKGVVFEIVGGDAKSLKNSLRRIKSYTYRLRGKFEKVKIVVVSHGLEQFELLRSLADKNYKLHRQVETLVKNHNVSVQVCSRFASMNGIEDDEFIDLVEVLDSSPVQIEEYRLKGYQIILMDFPKQ